MGDVREMDKVDDAGYYLWQDVDWDHDHGTFYDWYFANGMIFNNYNDQKDQAGIID